MKKTITQLTALFTICLLVFSCDGGKDEKPSLTGKWKIYERTLKSSNTSLDKSMNYAFAEEIKERDITRTYTDLTVTTTTRKKDTEDPNGLIKEVTESYTIKGDSIYISDVLYGGERISKYLISEKILTTYMKITSQDLRNMASDIGIDPYLIPDGITGELKIKEIR